MDHNQNKTVGKDNHGSDKFVRYPFRSLTNYKDMHEDRAKQMGKLQEFLAAPTLTRARQIVFP